MARTAKKPDVVEGVGIGISGFGDSVVRLTDRDTKETIAYVGKVDGEERIHFPRHVSPEQIEAVHELIQKKKFKKFVVNEKFDKAQAFADRKLVD